MRKKNFTLPLFFLVASLILVACGSTTESTSAVVNISTLAEIQERGVIRVGLAQTTPGAYIDIDTGEWTGINVDVANELAIFMGVELEIVETSWDLFLPALNNGCIRTSCLPGAATSPLYSALSEGNPRR